MPFAWWDYAFKMQLQNTWVDSSPSSNCAVVWWWNRMFWKSFDRISHQKTRPWKKVSGEIEKDWRFVIWSEIPPVHYLPSFCWCLLSDFKAAWMRSWLKMSLCKKKKDKPSTKHCFQTVYSLSTLPWYIVCTLLRPREQFSTHKERGMQASPSAPITEIYYSCLCTVLLVLTPCSVFTHREHSAFTHNSAPLWPISQQRILSYSREHVRVWSQLSIVKPQGFKILTWTEKRTEVVCVDFTCASLPPISTMW